MVKYFWYKTEGTLFYKQDRRHGILQTRLTAQYFTENSLNKTEAKYFTKETKGKAFYKQD